ncbi:MAG: DNA translocase FtsK [Thermodesulfobacteriota bacterium]
MNGNRMMREFSAVAIFFLALLTAVSLYSYWPMDPTFNQQVSSDFKLHNMAGLVGSYLAGTLVELFGIVSLLVPFLLGYIVLVLFSPRFSIRWWQTIGLAGIFVCLTIWAAYNWPTQHIILFRITGGGMLGSILYDILYEYFRYWGALLVLICCSLLFLQLAGTFSWTRLFWFVVDIFVSLRAKLSGWSKEETLAAGGAQKVAESRKNKKRRENNVRNKKAKKKNAAAKTQPAIKVDIKREFPDLNLLALPEKEKGVDQGEAQKTAQRVRDCLEEFGIQGEVQNTLPGPVITMLEYKPAPGVKVSRIANLHDDLARALKAVSVRIIAPLPGKDTVGIEIPNKKRQTVFLREILESSGFTDCRAALPMVLGQDIQGGSRVEDLARMPHLLVAGATGTGKSVCLNTLIVSLLFNSGPKDLKFLLIDPKRIELAVYNDLPHLVHPVVTDMSLAQVALDWAVHEMENRYDAMARLGVRNIEAYNSKLYSVDFEKEPELNDLQPMPYMVVIIDELADLMLTAAKEVEVSIVRLAQLARAAGIHLILATQRPSVDVVTGIIKANFPSRVAFQVSSKHDSRTILDSQGAEYLLGMGDMLFKAGGGQLQRIHGALVQDEEIVSVVEFWKRKGGGQEQIDLSEFKDDTGDAPGGGGSDPVLDDPKYKEAVEFVMDHGKASISLIQRRLRIGFNKAALFIEQMERDGIIGSQEGSKPRQVLKKFMDR